MSVIIKNQDQIAKITQACKLVASAHERVASKLEVGMSTYQVENIVKHTLKEAKAKSAFYKYAAQGKRPFPGHICISVNEEIVHGIASHSRKLQSGDVLSVDIGCILDGYYGDAARSYVIGSDGTLPQDSLVNHTKQVLDQCIEMTKPGMMLFDISAHIEASAKQLGYGNVTGYYGHGVGIKLHEPPTIPNYVPAPGLFPNIKLQPGMVITYEPMFTLGGSETEELSDGWTVVTRDRSQACHWEHTIAITEDGAQVLTQE